MENPAEVQEIRNKLRMMKFPQDEILNTVRKQQRAIHKQKQANETIRNEITEYEGQIAKINHSIEKYKTDEELQRLQTQKKNLSNKLSVLNNDFAVEESKRKKLEEDVSKANSKTGGLFQQSRENEELQARLRTMENRLDKALVRYNSNLSKLGELRSQIDELRKERNTFQRIIKNAEAERERNDQEMARLISDSNEAYSDRDRMKMDLAELKQKEKESIRSYETDISLLTQQIEGQRITQSHPREQQQQIPSMSSQLSSQTDQQEELVQQTEQLHTSNQRTLDLLGRKRVEELFAAAEKLERENFSLFNFVVEHGSNKTRLEEEISGLQLQYESLQSQSEEKEEGKKEELTELTRKIQEIDQQLSLAKEKKEKSQSDFTSVYTEIEQLFNSLECSWDESPDDKTNVTATNVMFALSSIESKIAAMMNRVAEKTKVQYVNSGISKFSSMNSIDTISRQGTTRGAPAKDTQSRIADSSRPMSIEEIRAMLG